MTTESLVNNLELLKLLRLQPENLPPRLNLPPEVLRKARSFGLEPVFLPAQTISRVIIPAGWIPFGPWFYQLMVQKVLRPDSAELPGCWALASTRPLPEADSDTGLMGDLVADLRFRSRIRCMNQLSFYSLFGSSRAEWNGLIAKALRSELGLRTGIVRLERFVEAWALNNLWPDRTEIAGCQWLRDCRENGQNLRLMVSPTAEEMTQKAVRFSRRKARFHNVSGRLIVLLGPWDTDKS